MKDIDASRFLRHYWLSKFEDKGERITIENLFLTFNNKAEQDSTFITQLLADVKEYGDIYLMLNEPSRCTQLDSKPENKRIAINSLEGIDAMNASRAFPVLMSAYKNCRAYFPRISRLIEILVFRYSLICNLDAKRLESLFNSIAVDLEEADKSDERGLRDLVEKEIVRLKKEIPTDDLFNSSFVFKSSWTSKAAKYVLSRIEMSELTPEIKIDYDNVNIEHIFPKSPSEDCKKEAKQSLEYLLSKTNSIGNLALIFGKWNQDMSNKKFSVKKRTFERSQFRLTKELAQLDSWNKDELDKRMQYCLGKCKDLWNPDKA